MRVAFCAPIPIQRHRLVWQSAAQALPASGAAVSIAANGDVVVAGTVSGSFDGAASDGDMLVARYSANGDEQFATLIRNIGAEQADRKSVV